MYIRDIHLSNVRCFESLTAHLSVPGDEHDGINFVIGPNMGGKSTLLHSTIWAIVSPKIGWHFVWPHKPLRDFEVQRRAPNSSPWSIEVNYSVGDSRRQAFFRKKNKDRYESGFDRALAARYIDPSSYSVGDEHQIGLLLYYPPSSAIFAQMLDRVPTAYEVEDDWTGFSPYEAALSADKIQRSMPLYQRYHQLARRAEHGPHRVDAEDRPFDDRPLLELLQPFLGASLGGSGFMSTDDGETWEVDSPGARIDGAPIHHVALSDGFRTAFGICIDLFLRFERMKDGRSSRACVYLDEVSGYLHPSWAIEFLPMLRSLLPNAQFIVATHSPHIVMSAPHAKVFSIERVGNDSTLVDRSTTSVWWTLQQTALLFEAALQSKSVDRLEREFESLVKSGDEERAQELAQVLAEIDPVFRVLSHLPTGKLTSEAVTRILENYRA